MHRLVRSAALTSVFALLGASTASAAVADCPAQPGHRVFDRYESDAVLAGGLEAIHLEHLATGTYGSLFAAGSIETTVGSEAAVMRYRADGAPARPARRTRDSESKVSPFCRAPSGSRR